MWDIYSKSVEPKLHAQTVDKLILLVKVAHLAPTVLAVLAEKRCGARFVGSAHTRQGDDPPAPRTFLTR